MPDQETILLVEDEPAIRKLITTALERDGFHVVEARHGREAVDVFEELHGQVDLLLTDMRLPYQSGEVVIEQLRERQPNLKVLSISGYPSAGAAADAHRVRFLEKPFTRDQLLQTVHEVLED